jgi:hypothetical protein
VGSDDEEDAARCKIDTVPGVGKEAIYYSTRADLGAVDADFDAPRVQLRVPSRAQSRRRRRSRSLSILQKPSVRASANNDSFGASGYTCFSLQTPRSPTEYTPPRGPAALPKKLFIRTFGCQMNEYDSDRMADVLGASDGLTLTERVEDADVILFNTCSVREKAQERVFHDLGRVRGLKAASPTS